MEKIEIDPGFIKKINGVDIQYFIDLEMIKKEVLG